MGPGSGAYGCLMLRPASWSRLTGESPVRVGTGAPGSRPRFVAERRRAERGVRSLFGGTTVALVAVLRTLTPRSRPWPPASPTQLDARPDAVIFTSLPRSGTIRAARLPAEIGDARGRFPARDFLTCLAGVAPSTRQSGKVKSVTFRRGAGKQLRDALCDFAGDSRSASPWAADLYDKAIARFPV